MGEIKLFADKTAKKIKRRFSKSGKELNRIRSIARYTEGSTNILGRKVYFVDSASFCGMYKEIIDREIYKFSGNTSSPLIIDCGANIGLSVLYFKKLYPDSKIIAFEADPRVFRILKNNITNHKLENITILNKAVSKESGVVQFLSEGADGGRIMEMDGNQKKLINIESVSLKSYLDNKVDFLKIDIEGSEYDVIYDCRDKLNNVEKIFIEYHSFINEEQKLGSILDILSENGFRYFIEQATIFYDNPFMAKIDFQGIDNLLNICAFRT
jgi:FkbM family methyltransferase